MKVKQIVKNVLIAQQNRLYARQLAERQVSFDAWIRRRETQRRPEPAEEQSNADLVYLCSGYGHGHPDIEAKAVCEDYFNSHPEILIAYGDEDVWKNNAKASDERQSPWFKPEWSPDLFDCSFYFGSLTVMRKELFDRAKAVCGKDFFEKAGFIQDSGDDVLYVNMSDTDTENTDLTDAPDGLNDKFVQFMHICVGLAGGYVVGRKTIGHIDKIIFHCNDEVWMNRFLPDNRLRKRFCDIQIRDFEDGLCAGDVQPTVSVIIPSKDNPYILEKCIAGIRKTIVSPLSFEIIVVDNGSNEKNKSRINKNLEALTLEGIAAQYIYEEAEFNFSHMCNLGAAKAAGSQLLFLNDDVELCIEDCILRMAVMSDRDYTGAVGIKLYYPDSRKIQHAGITNLPMGPVHKLQFLEDNICYYHGINEGMRNVIAVTAACLMVEKKKFDEVGGFSEELRVAFNDVDLCFGLFEMGYYNVCLNDCYAYHHESLSRGDDESTEKLNRLLKERDRLYRRHPKFEGFDPFYPEGLGRDGLDTRVRPEHETAGNFVQECEVSDKTKSLEGYRHDACLLFRVEWCGKGIIQGYGVVLGDNNACYEKELILEDIADENRVYAIRLEGQYRPDLVENMPDQTNVGLCGFKVRLCGNIIDRGSFRIGMAVKNRVNGTKIYNFGNRIFHT